MRAFTLYIDMKIRGRSLVVCLGLVCLSAARGQQYTIKTLAGNGSAGFAGDSGDAAASQLNSPHAVALVPMATSTSPIPATTASARSPAASITTVAGTCGTLGYSGDGAAATAATLNAPSGLAFDSAGNLYIADTGNSVIRKITGATITTRRRPMRGRAYGGDGGAATSANLNGPTAVALDAGRQPLHRRHRKQPDPQGRYQATSSPPIVGAGATDTAAIDHSQWPLVRRRAARCTSPIPATIACRKYVAAHASAFSPATRRRASRGDGGPALARN